MRETDVRYHKNLKLVIDYNNSTIEYILHDFDNIKITAHFSEEFITDTSINFTLAAFLLKTSNPTIVTNKYINILMVAATMNIHVPEVLYNTLRPAKLSNVDLCMLQYLIPHLLGYRQVYEDDDYLITYFLVSPTSIKEMAFLDKHTHVFTQAKDMPNDVCLKYERVISIYEQLTE